LVSPKVCSAVSVASDTLSGQFPALIRSQSAGRDPWSVLMSVRL
jgi:hypothetical protein